MTIRTALDIAVSFLRGSFSPKRLKTLAGIAAAVLFIFATLLPAEVYQYTGVDYTIVTPSSPYSTAQSVTATFTLNDPLGPNAGAYSAPYTSWTISDGVNFLSDSTIGTLTSLTFSTDGTGNITDWSFDATYTGGIEVSSHGVSATPLYTDIGTDGVNSGTSTVAGSWQNSPEPGTLGMMLAGSLLLFATMRRRLNKTI